MARRSARAWPDRERVLVPARTSCPACDGFMRVRYENRRRLETLSGSVRLRLKVRDCLSGEVLLARSLLSGTAADLAPLLREVADAAGVPVAGVISDGQTSIRRAVEQALPGVPHQLCHFHFLREAAHPIFEADRHAKVELKKQVRGIRRIERAVEGSDAAAAEVVRGYCAAVRSAITDDGRPPLAASGLTLKRRLEKVAA